MATSKAIALVIVPRVTGTLSALGSLLIILEVLRNKSNRSTPYHRILLFMSICDLNSSLWYACSTLPVPAESGLWGAKGNELTCNIQGWALQFGIAIPMYSTALTVYYMLTIRYNWKGRKIRRAEKFLHFIPLSFASITSFSAIPLKLYNNSNLWCWIAPAPASCLGSFRNNGINDCERGNNAWIYRWAFFYAPLWCTVVVSIIIMCSIILFVNEAENKMKKYKTMSSSMRKKMSDTTRVARQAYFFLGAYFVTWGPITVFRIIQTVGGTPSYAMILSASMFTPFQGFFNYFVYIRPRFLKHRKENPEWNIFISFFYVFFFKTFCEIHRESSYSRFTFKSTRTKNRITAVNEKTNVDQSKSKSKVSFRNTPLIEEVGNTELNLEKSIVNDSFSEEMNNSCGGEDPCNAQLFSDKVNDAEKAVLSYETVKVGNLDNMEPDSEKLNSDSCSSKLENETLNNA